MPSTVRLLRRRRSTVSYTHLFTERAFLNGTMDLTEAEAVIDLIDAETAEAARNAAAQVDGALRRPLEQV